MVQLPPIAFNPPNIEARLGRLRPADMPTGWGRPDLPALSKVWQIAHFCGRILATAHIGAGEQLVERHFRRRRLFRTAAGAFSGTAIS